MDPIALKALPVILHLLLSDDPAPPQPTPTPTPPSCEPPLPSQPVITLPEPTDTLRRGVPYWIEWRWHVSEVPNPGDLEHGYRLELRDQFGQGSTDNGILTCHAGGGIPRCVVWDFHPTRFLTPGPITIAVTACNCRGCRTSQRTVLLIP